MTNKVLLFMIIFLAGFLRSLGQVDGGALSESIEKYITPYVQTSNFSGSVFVATGGSVIFNKSFGFADRELKVRNGVTTRFHIASISMQFTAAAMLRLAEQGKVSLNALVSHLLPDVRGIDSIRVRDLLEERSGLPDINSMPDYSSLLHDHQTPLSLVKRVEGQPLLFAPGAKYLHEEHSAYNLLALIIERLTGLTFARAVELLVFQPNGMNQSGADDDSLPSAPSFAKGYEPVGTYEIQPADKINWSAKTGNASIYATTLDEALWINNLFAGKALDRESQNAMLDTSLRIGYGWFKGRSQRLGQLAYYMNGRSPGYSSFVMYLPGSNTSIIVFSNIYSSATTTIGNDIAAILLGLPYQRYEPQVPAPSARELNHATGRYKFGAGFYQPNAIISVNLKNSDLLMVWPDGTEIPLITLGKNHFLDRAYWQSVVVKCNADGTPQELLYGDFIGKAVSSN